MQTIEVKITGAPPGLLMNRFPEATQAGLVSNIKLSGKKKPTPQDEAEMAAYRMENGELGQPAEHIYQSLIKAAGDYQVQGKGKKTYRDAVKGNVLVTPEIISHGKKDYRIDARPVRIQRARIVRHRPWLPEWELSFTIQILEPDLLPSEVLNAILVKAGQTAGLGDYRPRYGRFVVTEWKPLGE